MKCVEVYAAQRISMSVEHSAVVIRHLWQTKLAGQLSAKFLTHLILF